MSYGVAGSSNPFADYTSRINVLLCNAVKARWNQDVHNDVTPPIPYPASPDDINFLNTWVTGTKDVEIIFREGFDDTPVQRRTTDWRYQGHETTVDIHIFVRGAGGDVEPPILNTVLNGLDKIIALNGSSLIENAIVDIMNETPGPTDSLDDRKTLWHIIMKVRVQYTKVRVV